MSLKRASRWRLPPTEATRRGGGALSSIDALPTIIDAAGGLLEILVDSGIRSGQDVIKALALGAHGTFICRAFLYGLGEKGEAGVTTCLAIIRNELDITMALCGLHDVRDVDGRILVEGNRQKQAGS